VAGTAARLAPDVKASGSSTPTITDAFDDSTAPGLTRQPAFAREVQRRANHDSGCCFEFGDAATIGFASAC
jgi:hypothetical protein